MRSCPSAASPPSLKSFLQSTFVTAPFGLNEAVRRDGFSLFNFSQRERLFLSFLRIYTMYIYMDDDAGALNSAAPRQIWESKKERERELLLLNIYETKEGARKIIWLVLVERLLWIQSLVVSSSLRRARTASLITPALWCKKLKSCDANGIDDEKRFDLLSFHNSVIMTFDYSCMRCSQRKGVWETCCRLKA